LKRGERDTNCSEDDLGDFEAAFVSKVLILHAWWFCWCSDLQNCTEQENLTTELREGTYLVCGVLNGFSAPVFSTARNVMALSVSN
jgi:hypothetical protein